MARYIDADLEVSKYVTVWDCDCSEFGKQTVMAVDDLHYLPTADVAPRAEWISVEERLPEQYGLFLIADDKGNMDAATWTKQFGWFSGSNRVKRVTHWMPLPEPPSRRAAERRLI